jgi:hypothetical protein
VENLPPEVSETLDALRKQSESIKLSNGPTEQDQPRFSADNTSNTYEAESLVQSAIRNSTENQYEEFEDRFEPGVYVTYGRARDDSTIFRRVRFKYSFPSYYLSSFIFIIFSFTVFYFFTSNNKVVVGLKVSQGDH